MSDHQAVRVYQERPGEFSWVCSCGTHFKHQTFGNLATCEGWTEAPDGE